MNRLVRLAYKRLGIIQLGRRRVRDLTDFIEDRKIDVVIDVGANVGQFGESLRSEGYCGKIVSFEPVKSAFQVLSKKAAADGNWEIHQCGLGATSGSAIIHVSELSVCSSILDLTSAAEFLDGRMAVDHTEKVAISTLDELAATLNGNILLKIDTQGFEKQVLEGGQQTIPRVKGILMELPIVHLYEGVWQFHEALKFMSDIGFVPAQIQPVGFHSKDNASAVEFDCLFRPRGSIDAPQNPHGD